MEATYVPVRVEPCFLFRWKKLKLYKAPKTYSNDENRHQNNDFRVKQQKWMVLVHRNSVFLDESIASRGSITRESILRGCNLGTLMDFGAVHAPALILGVLLRRFLG